MDPSAGQWVLGLEGSSPKPVVYQTPGDRQLPWQPYLPLQELLPGEPVGLLDFLAIDRDLAARVVGVEAQHERRRERPWLRRAVTAVVDEEARLLLDLASKST